jgi:hypothetical protein
MTPTPTSNPAEPCPTSPGGAEAERPHGLSLSAEPPPQFDQEPVRVGPLAVQPSVDGTIRGQPLAAEAVALVASGPVQTFLVERARGEVPLPGPDRLRALADGDVEWPATSPERRGDRPVRTPLATADREAVKDGLGVDSLGPVTAGATNVTLRAPRSCALLPWQRAEAAVRTAVAEAGGDYDPGRVRCFDCGFDGAVVVVAPAEVDVLGVETAPEAIEAAVVIRPVTDHAGVAEREPAHAPATTATDEPCRPDAEHTRRLIERARGDEATG